MLCQLLQRLLERYGYKTFQIVELANVYSKWLLIPEEIPRGFELFLYCLPCMLIFCGVLGCLFAFGRGTLNICASETVLE